MLFFIEIILLAFCCGTIAAVYRNILAYEPVLNWWFKFGQRFEKRWFFAPIWGCVRCISGQFGLWFFVFLEILPGFQETGYTFLEIFGLIFGLLFTICASILFAIVLSRLIKYLET
jgi:hypothetical protein